MTANDKNPPDASQDSPAQAKPTTQDRPRQKKERPSFETFAQLLSETIAAPSTKDELSTVMRILKRGFSGEVRPEQVNQVVDLIKNYRSVDRLAVQLTIAPSQKPSAISRAVLNRLRSWFAGLTSYPPEQADQDRLLDLTDWILAGSRKQDQPESTRFPADWLRMAFTCLASERDALVRCGAVYQLLSTIARTRKRGRPGPFSPDSQTFLREAAQLVAAKTISPRRIAAALQFAHPMEERARQHEATARDARNASLEATQKARMLAEENTQLRQQLDTATGRANEFRQQTERLTVQVSAEQERARELEKFWEKRSEQELARQRHQIATALAHDLQEACLALDRESPNAAMALNRVRAAHETVRSLGQAK